MKILVVVPSYPNENRVDSQFVHERVKEYIKDKKIVLNVFCLNDTKEKDYIFENIKVFVGNEERLIKLIKDYDKFIFHFFNNRNGKFILNHLKNKNNLVWFHGSDSVHWKRRISSIDLIHFKDFFNPFKLIKLAVLIKINLTRKILIKNVNKTCINTKFVFVSNWLYNTSLKDLKIKYKNYDIIPNYINEEQFEFKQKNSKDRYKVLSINNYANGIYAGDMIRDIIIELSKEDIFQKFEFNIYGDGKQWDETSKDLMTFENVHLHRGYLSRKQIKIVHQENGIFLYPKRGDSQGVSRCEAMSSGLVSIASNVEAIPEFNPSDTSYLASNIHEFIKYFKYVDANPEDFIAKSKRGAKFIRLKCGYKETIEKEKKLIKGELK